MTLPVVDIEFEPKLANNEVTLALEYVAGKPDSCDPLPKINPPVILPVVLMVLEPNAANNVVTLALPYELVMPVSCDPLPRK